MILRLTTGDGVGLAGSTVSLVRLGRSGVETPTREAGPMRRSLGAGCTAALSSTAACVTVAVLAAAALASSARTAAAPFRGGEAAVPRSLEFSGRGVFDEELAADKLSGLRTAANSRVEDMDDTGAKSALSSEAPGDAASSPERSTSSAAAWATVAEEDAIAPRPTLAVKTLGETGGHGAAPHGISASLVIGVDPE